MAGDLRQEELWCHECTNYVQFKLDYDLDGRHILHCPVCTHMHYRIIRKGRITAERWGQDPRQGAGSSFMVTGTITASSTSMDVGTGWTNTIVAQSTSTGGCVWYTS